MKTLAFFSPLSPLESGVAVYADGLARQLAQRYKITFYIGHDYSPKVIADLGEVKTHEHYRGREDITLFQASNGWMHSYMYPHILRHGGIVTLHDSTLHDMVILYWERKPRWRFWMDFIANEGLGGIRRAVAPLPEGGGSVSDRIMRHLYLDDESKRRSFTFLKRVARRATGIITHSRWVAQAAKTAGADCPIMTVPLAVDPAPKEIPVEEARKAAGLYELSIGDKTLVVLVFGIIQRHKRIEQILDAWIKFAGETKDAALLFLGPRDRDFDIDKAVSSRGLDDRVRIIGKFAPMDKVWNYIFASDLCLNLRGPVYGSSSLSLMQILAAGKAAAVTNAETFSEFPDDVVKKVSDGPGEIEEIIQTLRWARDNPAERVALGRRALDYVESGCLWSQAGKRHIEFLDSLSKVD